MMGVMMMEYAEGWKVDVKYKDGAMKIYEKDGVRYKEYRSFDQKTFATIITTENTQTGEKTVEAVPGS